MEERSPEIEAIYRTMGKPLPGKDWFIQDKVFNTKPKTGLHTNITLAECRENYAKSAIIIYP